jgi:16S rRNA (uracil1498-N3)-methyltransferase
MSELPLFYAPDIASSDILPEEEAVHALRVLRISTGSEIMLTDGKGRLYKAVVNGNNPKRCEITVTERTDILEDRPYYLHIAIAPTKNIDRIEWFCEKATEIGIDEITLLDCRFSERRHINTSRLKKVMVSAMKQSLKAKLPLLNEMTAFKEIINRPTEGGRLIAHCYEGVKTHIKDALENTISADLHTFVMIGPEGDFSTEEVQLALEHGFTPVSLGTSRLRTETAALYACIAAQLATDGNNKNNYNGKQMELNNPDTGRAT